MYLEVKNELNISLDKAWEYWTSPTHIVNWNFASDEWCCPNAINNCEKGGTFSWRMEAKDGSMGFDFSGKYIDVAPQKHIKLILDDDRKVEIYFKQKGDKVEIVQNFQPENENPHEMQQGGWQAILNSFKKYVESN